MSHFKTVFAICLTMLFSLTTAALAQSDGFVRADGPEIVTADGQPFLIRGTNLGNWLLPEGYMWKLKKTTAHWQIQQLIKQLVGPARAHQFWQGWYDNYITPADIKYLKQIGCNTLRVPFNYKLLTPEDYPEVWIGPGFEKLDRVIDWCEAEGIYVILDMHAAPCGQTGTNIDDSYGHPWLFEDPECQARTVEIWRKIAERYEDRTIILGYDLINEPIPHFDGYEVYHDQLEPLYKRIVKAIREVDQNHMILLGGAVWNTNFKVFGKPFDDNLAYTFHKYWMDPVPGEIQAYVDFRDKYNVPIMMGESGENDDEWIDQFRTLLEKNNIGWTFWPYKKMDSTRSPRQFARPEYWDEVIAFAANLNLDPTEMKEHRPPIAHSQKALDQLLERIKFENSTENPGYVAALGLTPDPSDIDTPVPPPPAFDLARDVKWASPDGHDLHLDIYTPQTGKESYPVLVVYHGGGWLINNKAIMDSMSVYVASHADYVVCNVDYRLLVDNGNTINMNEIVEDALGAVLWIKDHIADYKGDPTKIAVTGDSAGGHLAAMVMLAGQMLESDGFGGDSYGFTPTYLPVGKTAEDIAQENGLAVQAALLSYGAFDLYDACKDHTFESEANGFWQWGGGKARNIFGAEYNVDDHPEMYKAVSPLYLIPDAKDVKLPPILCTVGEKDQTTPPESIKAFVSALKQKGHSVAYWEYEDRPHAFLDSQPIEFLGTAFYKDAPIALDKMIAFLDTIFVK